MQYQSTKLKQGAMVYLYTSKDAISCSFDYYYPDIESVLEDCKIK